jgi:hypothetical protein
MLGPLVFSGWLETRFDFRRAFFFLSSFQFTFPSPGPLACSLVNLDTGEQTKERRNMEEVGRDRRKRPARRWKSKSDPDFL